MKETQILVYIQIRHLALGRHIVKLDLLENQYVDFKPPLHLILAVLESKLLEGHLDTLILVRQLMVCRSSYSCHFLLHSR